MSCEIRQIASFVDINKCIRILNDDRGQSSENNHNSEVWLQDSRSAISPTGEILVIGRKKQLVVLSSKWDSMEQGDVKMKYTITWHGDPCQQMGEEVSSVLCLPLIPQGQSVSGTDWTCIVVGFSSGAVRFYTEGMNLLLSETLHNEPVSRVKCISHKTPRQGAAGGCHDSTELLYVVYKTVMCTVPGFGLFQTLRGCRNQLARQQAAGRTPLAPPPVPLDFKKYGFADQDAITDACFVGQSSVNTFDHLVTASLVGGFHSQYRPSPPQTSLIVAGGRKPFVGFHYTVEGGGSPLLTDVALAVASKIKDTVTASIPGWLGLGPRKPPAGEKLRDAAQEPAEQLGCRFGLCDLWRQGETVVLSPDGRLCAVADSLGRVFLVDTATGVAVRLWKGYREAQCGFLEVEEDVQKGRHRKGKGGAQGGAAAPRRALFIVIYAPKKGLVEAFATQQGARVASFKVSKQGRLLYTAHGMVGFSSPPTKGSNASPMGVVLLDREGLMDISLPFHCALSDSSSKKARDLHVLKKMKAFLKEEEYTAARLVEELERQVAELKTDEVRLQTLEVLMASKHVTAEALLAAAARMAAAHADVPDDESMDPPARNVVATADELRKLLCLYQFVNDLNNLPPNYNAVVGSSDDDPAALSEVLHMSEKDVGLVLDYVRRIQGMEGPRRKEPRVGFREEKTTDLAQFLSCFDVEGFVGARGGEPLRLKAGLAGEKCRALGEVLFKGLLSSEEWLNDWKTLVADADIDRMGLVKCLLSYWLDARQAGNVAFEMTALVEMLKAVCSLVDPKEIAIDYSQPSPWWRELQVMISGCSQVLPALMAAVCCRAVTIVIEQEKELARVVTDEKKTAHRGGDSAADGGESSRGGDGEDSGSPGGDWVAVSRDTWRWDCTIVQLEDVALLNTVLGLRLDLCGEPGEGHLARLPPDTVTPESLQTVLERGNGRVTELVSRWLTQFGLDPRALVVDTDVEFQAEKEREAREARESKQGKRRSLGWLPCVEEASEARSEDLTALVLEKLGLLKQRLPYSLTCSAVLCNLSWEYLAHWHRTQGALDSLHSALQCLKHIPNARVKDGISYLSWVTYIRHNFENAAKLVNKIGKVPAEKLCVQETGLTNLQTTDFLKNVMEFLNAMLESAVDKGGEFVANQEELWRCDVTSTTPSLVSLALSQPAVNEDLLLLHYELSVALYLIAALNVRLPKIYTTLFDSLSRSELFTELSKPSQVSAHHHNARLKAVRLQFLCRCVSGAVQTVHLVEAVGPPGCPPGCAPATRLAVEDYTRYLRLCLDLASMWDVSLDDVRRHQVCELYASGFDRLAEEVILAVNESGLLARQLLVVAGQRLKTFLDNAEDRTEKIANLSPALTSWLDSLDGERGGQAAAAPAPLSDLAAVLSHVLHWLPEGDPDLTLAVLMSDAVPNLSSDGQH